MTDAPALHVVITVCDNTAGEVCPIWPGGPVSAHWGLPDPAAVQGSPQEVAAAFAEAHAELEARIRKLVMLRPGTLDRDRLKQELDKLATMPVTAGQP